MRSIAGTLALLLIVAACATTDEPIATVPAESPSSTTLAPPAAPTARIRDGL